jgi:hypothetical protein
LSPTRAAGLAAQNFRVGVERDHHAMLGKLADHVVDRQATRRALRERVEGPHELELERILDPGERPLVR